ncbi:MAG: exodeoxyribonuclease VII large subunit [Ruminococcaceae bacterium]|nr:exodeoxyribonuclease VII large subunit [Oscillospiraceae bacterium]
MSVITVSQLNNYIKRYFDNNVHLQKVWIKGEISNFKKHYTGHLYLTLKDENSVLKAIMFKGSTSTLKFNPDNGMKVIACGKVAVFERDGQYQLYIESMIPDGVGELHIAYEQLKEKLEKEGLFATSHKKEIPKYPARIGVITSPTGAAIRDILNVLKRRYTLCDIIIYPAQVQGVGAGDTIVKGIETFNKLNSVDVIIAGRGGGSIEDLWAFNEEKVAYAIYNSKIPIISAVGHETDFTIADFVADLRAPTPSAGAELAVPSTDEISQNLLKTKVRLISLLKNFTVLKKSQLNSLLKRPVLSDYKSALNGKKQHLDDISNSLIEIYKKITSDKKTHLLKQMSKLEALNPISVIKRGFSYAQVNGKVVKSVNDVKSGDKIKITVTDGEITAIAD